MENHFETGIDNLRQKLLLMASRAETSVNEAVQALMQRNHDLAVRVRRYDDMGKVPDMATADIESYRPLLSRFLRTPSNISSAL